MDDFTIKTDVPNMVGADSRASQRDRARQAPAVVDGANADTRNGQAYLALSSPGGSRIITIILQIALNMIDYGMQPQEPNCAARIQNQWLPDTVFVEPFALSPDTVKLLQGMGYTVTERTVGRSGKWSHAMSAETARRSPRRETAARSAAMSRPGLVYGQ